VGPTIFRQLCNEISAMKLAWDRNCHVCVCTVVCKCVGFDNGQFLT
jgi:hypothetical protein